MDIISYLQFTIPGTKDRCCILSYNTPSEIYEVTPFMQSHFFPGQPDHQAFTQNCVVFDLDPKHVVGEIACSICIRCSTILLDKFMVFTSKKRVGFATYPVSGISVVPTEQVLRLGKGSQ